MPLPLLPVRGELWPRLPGESRQVCVRALWPHGGRQGVQRRPEAQRQSGGRGQRTLSEQRRFFLSSVNLIQCSPAAANLYPERSLIGQFAKRRGHSFPISSTSFINTSHHVMSVSVEVFCSNCSVSFVFLFRIARCLPVHVHLRLRAPLGLTTRPSS